MLRLPLLWYMLECLPIMYRVLKRFRAYTSHRMHGKTVKQRRQLRKGRMVSAGDFKRIRRMVANMR